MCPPAVRTLLVVVYAWVPEPGYGAADGRAAADSDGPNGVRTRVEALPVLALESVVYRDYTFPDGGGRDTPVMWGTEEQALERGWLLAEQGVEVRPVFVHYDDVGAAWLMDDEDHEARGGEHELVAAPWPPDEDDARLAPVVARLTQSAVEKARRRAMKEAQAAR
jgi:hypothetical protein